jgi:hypothetical protein
MFVDTKYGMTNAEIPGSPEYGKGYKIENNAGCPCNCIIPQKASCKTIVQRYTRYDFSEDLVSEKDCGCSALIQVDCQSIITENGCTTSNC